MELFEAIFGRRSIRRFAAGEVGDADLRRILSAGFAAPSARDTRPCHFLVVCGRARLDAVITVHPHAGMLREAACGIVCCGDTAVEASIDYLQQNVAAAIENMLLAAHGLGLGAVWLGIYPRSDRVEGIRAIFRLPEPVVPIGMIALGRPAEKKPGREPYAEECVHREHW